MRFPDHPAFTLDRALFRAQVVQVATLPRRERAKMARCTPVLAARVQTILASDPRVSVRAALGRNPLLLRSVQLTLAQDENVHVRSCLALNTALHPEAQLILWQDEATWEFLVRSGNISLEQAEECARSTRVRARRARRALAASPATSPELLVRMYRDALSEQSVPVLHALASNPSTPWATLLSLASDPMTDDNTGQGLRPSSVNEYLLRSVVLNAAAPGAFLRDMFTSHQHDTHLMDSLARSSAVPLDVLRSLSQHPAANVRRSAASNPSLPTLDLSRLTSDTSELVRAEAARATSLPRDLVHQLLGDPEPQVRVGVVRRTDLTDEEYLLLVADGHDQVLHALASYGHVPDWVLQHLPVRLLRKVTVESWVDAHPRRDEVLVLAPDWNGTFPELLDALERL